MPKVKVLCRIVNGLTIKRYAEGFDDGTGKKPLVPIDAGITLNGPSALHAGAGNTDGSGSEPGVTIVDKEWIEAWLTANEKTLFVTGGYIEIVPDSEITDEEPVQDPSSAGSGGSGTGTEGTGGGGANDGGAGAAPSE